MKKNKNIIIENVTVIDAGAKGKSVAKAPDGRVIFISNAVPGDVVDVQTTKKRLITRGRLLSITNYQNNVLRLYVNTLAIVGDANGRI